MDSNSLFAADTFAWGLQGMCHLHRIPFAPNLVLQQIPPPYTLLSLQQAAQSLGLKAGLKDASVADLAKLPLPGLAVLKPASPPQPDPAVSSTEARATPSANNFHRLALIIKADGSRVAPPMDVQCP